MAKVEWFDIRVVLDGHPDSATGHRPGRIVLAAPGHTYRSLAEVIDLAFGRWLEPRDRFFATGGQHEIGAMDGESSVEGMRLDFDSTPLGPELFPGHRFSYTCVGLLSWRHECVVGRYPTDPREHRPTGSLPRKPFVIDGWGALPDPQGRISEFDQAVKAIDGTAPVIDVISDEDHNLVRSYCQNKIPERVRDQIRLDCERTVNTLAIFECRPPWKPESADQEWTSMPIAQFTRQADGGWTLQCRYSDLRWHEYEPLPASPELAILLAEVDTDPTSIFWG